MIASKHSTHHKHKHKYHYMCNWCICIHACTHTHIPRTNTCTYTTQSRGCFTKSRESGGVTVEIKVLIIAFSYIFIGLVASTSFAVSSSKIERIKEEVFAYFHCERCGVNKQLDGNNCSRNGFERLTHDALVTMAYSLFGLYSLITLVYVIRVSDLKKCCGMIWKRFCGLKLSTTMMSQMASEGRYQLIYSLSLSLSLINHFHFFLQ